MKLDHVQPQLDALLELLVGLVLGLVLYIQDGWQVTTLQLDILDKELSLGLCRRMDTIEMIGTTSKSKLSGLIEVVNKILINLGSSFCGFYHDKAYGKLVYHALVFECLPIDVTLMVADVDTMDFIAFRVADVTIQGTKTETKRTDEEIIEKIDIECRHHRSAYPPRPTRHVL